MIRAQESRVHTCSVMPSSTYNDSSSNHIPVAVVLLSPESGSMAYRGALPVRASQICVSVTQPPRVLPSADSRYSRFVDLAYRMLTSMLASHSGLAMGSFGEGVSSAAASLAAAKLRSATAAPRRVMTTARGYAGFLALAVVDERTVDVRLGLQRST